MTGPREEHQDPAPPDQEHGTDAAQGSEEERLEVFRRVREESDTRIQDWLW